MKTITVNSKKIDVQTKGFGYRQNTSNGTRYTRSWAKDAEGNYYCNTSRGNYQLKNKKDVPENVIREFSLDAQIDNMLEDIHNDGLDDKANEEGVRNDAIRAR